MRKKLWVNLLAPVTMLVLFACGTDSVLAPSAEPLRFSDWSAPVNVGPPVNSALAEQTPAISSDGLSLYFHCIDCPGGYGGVDIFVSRRASVNESWGLPQNLGPAINTAFNEGSPALSRDERSLYFDSNRPDGFGGSDLYVASRHDTRDNFGWQAAANLGPSVNTIASEQGAEYFEDDVAKTAVLYFASTRTGGSGNEDVYSVALQPGGTFGLPTSVVGLNTPARESGPAIRRDGLEIFFVSDRQGGHGGVDIWVATRASISDGWSTPVNLGQPINGIGNDAGPALSLDGTALYFHSAQRPGNVGGPFFDLWMANRQKMNGR